MRPATSHALTVGLWSVASAERRPDGRKSDAALGGQGGNLSQRHFEILVDVVAQAPSEATRTRSPSVQAAGPAGRASLGGRWQ